MVFGKIKFSNKLKKSELYQAYRDIFATPQGELVLKHLAKICHLDEPVSDVGSSENTYYRDGRRSVVLQILRMMDQDVYSYIVNQELQDKEEKDDLLSFVE